MKNRSYLLLLPLFWLGCKSSYYTEHAQANNFQVNDSITSDSAMQSMIAPYKKNMELKMGTGLVYSQIELENKKPEGSLGNFVADALKKQAEKLSGQKLDLAFTHISGLRVAKIPAGGITMGRIYELIPFNNKIVVATIKGSVLKKIFSHAIDRGGECFSDGVVIYAFAGEERKYRINGNAVQDDKEYKIAVNDFLFYGGEGYEFEQNNFKAYDKTLRDAVIEEMKDIHSRNLQIEYVKYGRVFIQ